MDAITNDITNNGNLTAHPLQSGVNSDLNKYMTTNEKDYSKFGYFLTGVDVTQQNLDQLNPFIKGYARLFMYTKPYFMEKAFPALTNRFKSYIETAFRSVNGINDLSVNFTDLEGGYNGQKFSVVQGVQDDTDTITIGLYEMSGNPISEFLKTWVTGVRDPRSGVATYHGFLKGPMDDVDDTHIVYSEKNHTAEFIYVVTDSTGKYIEYACMLAHCFPTKVDQDHYNYDTNSHDAAEVEVELRCTKYESRYINDIAAFYLQIDTLKWGYLDFDPMKDMTTADVQREISARDTTFASNS